MDAEHILDIFGALEANGLLRHTHLLTGYVPGAEALQAVASIVDRMRAANDRLIYVLDPVMGDDGKLVRRGHCRDATDARSMCAANICAPSDAAGLGRGAAGVQKPAASGDDRDA